MISLAHIAKWFPFLMSPCLVVAAWIHSCIAQSSSQPLSFQTAPGLTIEPVALEPLVRWPMLADWDSDGRLVVVESGGVARPIEEHNKQLLHKLVRLVDEDGDGVMDRRILAADRLPFTEGVLCLGDVILVSAPPHIWKLEDGDGDGFCEKREIWFDGQTITGCANDLHGPYLGRDGWIYWSKGAFAEQTHQLLDGSTLSDRAAHIFRRHPSGGAIEPVMSGGMDNPVGFCVLPNGERFFSSTFLVHPRDGKRDGIVHSIYGGAYGKDHSALDGVIRTGPLMPIMAHLGPAAPSGLICLKKSSGILDSPNPILAAALFNYQKVIGLPLEPQGSSYQTTPVDLAVGSRIDFHPTDVIEDSDGSLLIIDTGGWYDLCCPSSRIDQQTAAGGIYRLRSDRSSGRPSERSPKFAWDGLSGEQVVELLDDPRPWIARSALLEIATRGDRIVAELERRLQQPGLVPASRQNALWAIGSIGTDRSLRVVVAQLHDLATSIDWQAAGQLAGQSSVEELQEKLGWIQIGCHLLGLYRFQPAQELLEVIFQNSLARVDGAAGLARAAAEALGRLGSSNSVHPLMGSANRLPTDRVLDHSVRYALLEIAAIDQIAAYLDSESPEQVRLALSTLDLLNADSHLTSSRLLELASHPDSLTTVAAVMRGRPEMASEVLDKLGPGWVSAMRDQSPPDLFRQLSGGWSDVPQWQQWVADSIRLRETGADWQWAEVALDSIRGRSVPPIWYDWLCSGLKSSPRRMGQLLSDKEVRYDLESSLAEFVLKAIEQSEDADTKLALIRCLPPEHACPDESIAAATMAAITDDPQDQRAWQVLRRLRISPTVAQQLVDLTDGLSPMGLAQAVEIIASANEHPVDRRLLNRLGSLPSARSLPRGLLVNVFRDRPESLRRLVEQSSDQLLQADPEIEQKVREILSELPVGDPVRGLTTYHGSKANCGACHQMGYRGGRIGPELTRIGSSRTRESLLEAILFPSQRIEQGFQSTQVLTVDGRVFHGIVSEGRSDELLELTVAADRRELIPVESIEEIRPSEVSVMPAGMLELLTRQELADLLSLLEAAR
jgi:putative membrane-bound dehydrogenase-like protein